MNAIYLNGRFQFQATVPYLPAYYSSQRMIYTRISGDELAFECSGEIIHPEISREISIPTGAIHSVGNISNQTAH